MNTNDAPSETLPAYPLTSNDKTRIATPNETYAYFTERFHSLELGSCVESASPEELRKLYLQNSELNPI